MVLAVTGYVLGAGSRSGVRARGGPHHRSGRRGADLQPVLARLAMAGKSEPPAEEIIRVREGRRRPRIATITFERPEFLNAPTIAAAPALCRYLARGERDDDVKVLIVRGVGDDLGQGADLPSPWKATVIRRIRLAGSARGRGRRRSHLPGRGHVPQRRDHQRLVRQPHAGIPGLQDFKKISILEAKGYCYGWHFYQCADADLVISSDDALFGHPSFRYYGWGPRMWSWVQTMGIRKFQEMVFTGRPFTAAEMYDCNFLNKVVAREQLEAEVEKYALACARNRPMDTVFHAEGLLRGVKQLQGEYMGSLLSAFFESMGNGVVQTTATSDLADESIEAGLAAAVNDNDSKFPPEFRLSKKPRGRKTE